MTIETTIEQIGSTDNTMQMEIIQGIFAGVKYTITVEEPTEDNPSGGLSYAIDNQKVLQDVCLNLFRKVVESDFDERVRIGTEKSIDESLLETKE